MIKKSRYVLYLQYVHKSSNFHLCVQLNVFSSHSCKRYKKDGKHVVAHGLKKTIRAYSIFLRLTRKFHLLFVPQRK